MTSRPRQASGGDSGVIASRDARAFAVWLNDSRVTGWRWRAVRPGPEAAGPWRVVPIYRVKAPSRPMPAEAGA